MNRPAKIISGGQTGVDQGALDFALNRGLECGGWCPPGRQCEKGLIPEIYPLQEVEDGDYHERTRRNIQDADATLIITAGGRMEEGTRLTLEWLEELNQPFFHLDLENINEPDDALLLAAETWMENSHIYVLNVAGNSESTSPGIHDSTILVLEKLYGISRRV